MSVAPARLQKRGPQSMLESIYYSVLGVAFIWSLLDWRRGLYLCLIFDIIRDPIRKLSDEHLVYITVSGSVLWLAVFVGASREIGGQLFSPVRMFPTLR